MRIKTFCALFLLSLLFGCAGRTANPTSVAQPGDAAMTCEQLSSEMQRLDAEARKKFGEQSGKTGKNVALGVAGAFLLVPLFFMDFSDAERVEAEAMRDRFRHLQRLGENKNCNF